MVLHGNRKAAARVCVCPASNPRLGTGMTGVFQAQVDTGLRARLLAAFARPRMGLIIHLGKVLKIEVGVNLGGGDVGVAEHFLDGA